MIPCAPEKNALMNLPIDPSENADSATTDASRESNRLKLHVPFSDTYVVMGRGLTGARATYDGFCVRTKERVFLDAEKNVVIQSNGHSIFKAYGEDANLYAVADQHAVVAAKGAASLLGSGGALIFGGLGGGALAVNPESGDRDTPFEADGDDSAESVRENRNKVAAAFLTLDVLLGLGLLANTAFQSGRTLSDKAADKKIRKGASALFAGAATAVGVSLSTAALANTAKSSVPGPAGATIFGEAGVLTGTYGFNAAYALGGIAQVAPFTMSFGFAEATLASMHTTSVTSYLGTVTVDGRTKVKVHSGHKVSVTAGDASNPGKLLLDADTIDIGSQPLTTSCKSITMKSNDLLPTPASESEFQLAAGEVVLNAGTSLKIKVGVGPQEVTVSIENGTVTVVSGQKAATIRLGPSGAEIEGKTAAGLKSKGGINVDAALDVAIKAKKNVEISGQKVNIM